MKMALRRDTQGRGDGRVRTIYVMWTRDARELDELEALLKSGQRIRTLFCEVPCNPLLESSDLLRVRALADGYGFVVACDETLGTFVNIDLLPYADFLMMSLTKFFSGASNVMGGR